MTNNELLEKLSALEHEQWSHWMKYLFSKCDLHQIEGKDYGLIIPREFVERWEGQMNAEYKLLTEDEKESDREWGRRVLAEIRAFLLP